MISNENLQKPLVFEIGVGVMGLHTMRIGHCLGMATCWNCPIRDENIWDASTGYDNSMWTMAFSN